MATDDEDVWFEPKAIGIGAGPPVAWQGWALVGAYLAFLVGLSLMLKPHHPVPYYILVAAGTIALMVVAQRHTRGGWRWRP